MLTLDSLVSRLAALPPSCGPTRLIGVDGFAGSGKTTFAAHLSAALSARPEDAPVVHLDDLATHEQFFDWTDRLRSEVLEPLAAGRPVRHRVYDWTLRRFAASRELAAAPPFLLLEGVGAGRRAVRPYLAAVVWMELDALTARARGEDRDGPDLSDFWSHWFMEQSTHFQHDPTRPFANFLVDGATGEPLGNAG
jgi:hypothetical protein